MYEPVFNLPVKWKYENAKILSEIEESMASPIEGIFNIEVGSYGEHQLYIRGNLDIEKNDDRINIYLTPFVDGDFIFDLEQLGNSGNYMVALSSLNEMWQDYPEVCEKAFAIYQAYFDNNPKEAESRIFECLERTDPENFEKLNKILKVYKYPIRN